LWLFNYLKIKDEGVTCAWRMVEPLVAIIVGNASVNLLDSNDVVSQYLSDINDKILDVQASRLVMDK
jgi:hypothetical protein